MKTYKEATIEYPTQSADLKLWYTIANNHDLGHSRHTLAGCEMLNR